MAQGRAVLLVLLLILGGCGPSLEGHSAIGEPDSVTVSEGSKLVYFGRDSYRVPLADKINERQEYYLTTIRSVAAPEGEGLNSYFLCEEPLQDMQQFRIEGGCVKVIE